MRSVPFVPPKPDVISLRASVSTSTIHFAF